MKYHLTIKKLEENTHYEAELKEWSYRNRNFPYERHNQQDPKKYEDTIALETILTEDEFKKVKKAVVEIM